MLLTQFLLLRVLIYFAELYYGASECMVMPPALSPKVSIHPSLVLQYKPCSYLPPKNTAM